MAAKTTTRRLLDELEAIDHREDHILDVLLRHGERLEAAERLSRAVTAGDLRALETALAETQARIARALADASGGSASNGGTPATFDALAASLRAQDAESDRLRALLRERLLALKEPAGGGVAGADPHAADPGGERPRTFRLTRQRMHGADVKAFQGLLNRRFAAWGVHKRIAESGTYDAGTRQAARQVARGLGVAPADYVHGITPALQTLIRMPSRRTPRQLERARAQRGWLRRLRDRYRHHAPAQHHAAAGKPVVPAHPSALAAAIRAHGGRYEHIIVREAKRSKLPVSLVCAVIEQESGFRNVFGHDKVSNPIKSPNGGLLAVTHERYLSYLHHRHLGQGCQGVGPMQLTSAGLQDAADGFGGCWRPGPNIREGCAHLAGLIRAHGMQAGVQAYNHAGGHAYSDPVLALERVWRHRLAGAHAAGTKVPSRGPKGTPRTFRLTSPPLSGQDVRAFQHVLNGRFDAWGVHRQIAENGMYTAETRKAARQVARGLGIAAADYAHGITPAVQRVIRMPNRRTPRQLELARQHRDWLRRLRKHHAKQAGRSGALRLRAHVEARKLVGVMETGGNNHGKVVLEIIRANAGKPGEEWCGDFLAYCYRKAGSKSVTRNWAGVRLYLPMTGLKATKTPLKGDIARYTKLDHIGMFVCWCDAHGTEVAQAHATHITTIEGNTTSLGALSPSTTGGQGVYKKLRPRSVVSEFIHVLR